MVMKPAHVPFHLNEGLGLFAILTFVGVNKACCKRTSKATFRKAQISNKLIFSHHDKNSIKYAILILICMIIHLSKGWWAIKCNKITRKHFVRMFKVLCRGNGFLQPPSKKERENLFTKTFYNRLEQVSRVSEGRLVNFCAISEHWTLFSRGKVTRATGHSLWGKRCVGALLLQNMPSGPQSCSLAFSATPPAAKSLRILCPWGSLR